MAESLFSACNTLALVGWLLLIFAPSWRYTTVLITSVLIPSALAIVYITLMISSLGNTSGGFGSLSAVSQLFKNQYVLLAGWVHYLAFDLFVGTWQVRETRRIGFPHWLVVPCLVLTFLFGPTGLLAYYVLRFAVKRQLIPDSL